MIKFELYNEGDYKFYNMLVIETVSMYGDLISKTAIRSSESYLNDSTYNIVIIKKKNLRVGVFVFEIRQDFCHVNLIVIDEKYKGQGIGSIILGEIEKFVEDLGVNIITLNVLKENKEAIKFYLRHGYISFEKTITENFTKDKFQFTNMIFLKKVLTK